MSASSEVVVIGGGVEGSSIAYHLAKRGAKVTLLERWEIASAASGASAGGVRHQGRDRREFPLAFLALERWRTLETELGADVSYRRDGHLTTIEHDGDLSDLIASIASQAAAGLDIRLVQGDELRAIVPGIASTVIAGAYSPNDGHANPGDTTRAFARAAERLGAKVQINTIVSEIVIEGGTVAGVVANGKRISADRVVLAAGAWSAGLAAAFGVTLPIEAQGFQAMTTTPAPASLNPVMGSVRRLISLKQLPDGRYLLGGGWPGKFDLTRPRGTSLQTSQRGNKEAAIGIWPAVAEVEITDAWLGIEAVTADEVPIIGPVAGTDGLVIAAGFSGHGFALSPAVGEAVAELIFSGSVPPALAALGLERFAAGAEPKRSPAGRAG